MIYCAECTVLYYKFWLGWFLLAGAGTEEVIHDVLYLKLTGTG